MPTELTKEAKQELVKIAAGAPGAGNPFVREAGNYFLRYDRLGIASAPDGTAQALLYWRGMHVATEIVPKGAMMMLDAMEGRLEVRITP